MPFVPLGRRCLLEVVLDDDKARNTESLRASDNATVLAHAGHAASSSGYRFGNHAATRGRIRAPDVPFRAAHSSWRPPSADPSGPAARREEEQSQCVTRNGLRMNTSLSLPELSKAEPNMTHPLTRELKHWDKLANQTLSREMTDFEVNHPVEAPPMRMNQRLPGSMVNFPKYMLINNCHLKTTETQRFGKEQHAERAAAEAALARAAAGGGSLAGPVVKELQPSAVKYGEASWGAPLLREEGYHWAGSALPAGRGQRSSNQFRM